MSKSTPQSPMGQRIIQRMEELGLNAKQLSLSAGLNETYVRDLLKAETPNPRLNHLKALAEKLDVTVEWLDTGEKSADIVSIWDRIPDRDAKRRAREYLENLAIDKDRA